jgi:tetratricopeptide (TPR) repeat protein
MQATAYSFRHRVSSLALGLAVAFGGAAVIAVTAPAAVAQQKSSKEFVEAYTAGTDAVKAKDWNKAISAAEKASSYAKERNEKLAVINLRIAGYGGLRKTPELIKTIEDQLAIGGLSKEQVNRQQETLAGLYAAVHNDAKAAEITKQLIADKPPGSAEQNAFLASYALRTKNHKEAITYANKAIDITKKAGRKPKEAWYQIVQKAYFEQKDDANFYATVERTAQDYPTAANLEILINKTTKEPHFNRTANMLDLNRALQAAKVTIKPTDLAQMGEDAISRENPAESAKIFEGLSKTNWAGIDTSKQARYKSMYAKAQADAKAAAAGGLAGREKDAATAPKGDRFVDVGDAYLGAGENAKAIEMINKGLAKGNLDAGQLAYAKLDLGIALYRSGKKDDARKTWGEITGDNGAAVLAKNWILISRN